MCLQQRRALTTPPLPRLHQLARVIVPGNAGRLVTVIALVEQTSIKAQLKLYQGSTRLYSGSGKALVRLW